MTTNDYQSSTTNDGPDQLPLRLRGPGGSTPLVVTNDDHDHLSLPIITNDHNSSPMINYPDQKPMSMGGSMGGGAEPIGLDQ